MTQPYDGLSTRTRHPERPLYLPDGTELLVSMGYVRAPRGRGPRARLVARARRSPAAGDHPAQRRAAGAAGAQPGGPGLDRRA